MAANAIASALREAGEREREECAVTAWRKGMELNGKAYDPREIGSACASAIRNRSAIKGSDQ
jgi:hypothetical protein